MMDAATSGQFLRYAFVGLVSNLLLYLAYLGLTVWGLGHKTAMTLVYVLGVLSTFVANRAWSFKHQGIAQTAFVRYLIAYILGYLLNLGLLWLAVDRLRLPHQWIQAGAIVAVAVSLFLMHKFWVFAPSRRDRVI